MTTWPECLCSIVPNKKQTTGHLEKRVNQAQSLFYKHPVFVLYSKSFESKIRAPSLHVFFLAEVIIVTLPHPSCSDVRMSNRKHSNLQSTVSIIQCRLFFLSGTTLHLSTPERTASNFLPEKKNAMWTQALI